MWPGIGAAHAVAVGAGSLERRAIFPARSGTVGVAEREVVRKRASEVRGEGGSSVKGLKWET